MKTEIHLIIPQHVTDEVCTNPKPKFKPGSTVWAARVSIKPGGLVQAVVVKCKVIGYTMSGWASKDFSKPKYTYSLLDIGDQRRFDRMPNRVFKTEREANQRVYTLLHGFADQIEKMAFEFLKA